MEDLRIVEQTEQWMYQYPRTAVILLAGFLMATGVVIGVGVATNIYDSGMTQMFQMATEIHRPVVVDNKLYGIEELDTLDPQYECVFVPSNNST